jgi:hypothetical protein
LKQRRLKDESRWKFNPNADYSNDEDESSGDEEWFEDTEYDDRR